MRLIIGLGNPGKEYEKTRHNAGFMAVDFLVKKLDGRFEQNKKFNALIFKKEDTIFVKPLTFMNNSGFSVVKILSYFKLLPKTLGVLKNKNSDLSEILTVIHDDVDIELGKYKTSINSGSAGHNGIKSIINHLKTKNFKRIRIGILTENKNKIPTEKFVLQKFGKEELEKLENVITRLEI